MLLIVNFFLIQTVWAAVPTSSPSPEAATQPELEYYKYKDGDGCRKNGRRIFTKGHLGECGDIYQQGVSGITQKNMNLRGLHGAFGTYKGNRLPGVDLSGAIMAQSTFELTNLQNMTAPDSIWVGTRMSKVNMNRSKLASADISGIKVNQGVFIETSFRNAKAIAVYCNECDFTEADFRGADLRESLFFKTKFLGALFDADTKLPFSKERALAQGMIFRDAELTTEKR